jgi:3-oxoacyl-[acyl-carrier-protein] synthase II
MNSTERIVVTGAGVVSPLGTGVDAFHQALADGRSGISPIQFPWPTAYSSLRAGRVSDLDFAPLVPAEDGMGRASRLAVASTRLALDHAGIAPPTSRPDRIGVVVGTALGDATELEAEWQRIHECDAVTPSPQGSSWMRLGNLAEHVSAAFGLEGPSHLLTSTCAAGNHAIAWSAAILQAGTADVMVAAGADTIGYVDILGFTRLLLQAPERCQPFDRHRKGTILSEGAAALVLETLSSARRRGAPILAEVLGYGTSCDAAGPFASCVTDTRGMRVAFERALRKARISPDVIDHVSAHGSGTRLNDQKETLFLKEVLGERAYHVPVSAIKAMLGHAQGAAALFEAVACVLTLTRRVMYPTINYETPDPKCDLDYIPNEARERDVETILSNAFGVGGNNALVIFRRWDG